MKKIHIDSRGGSEASWEELKGAGEEKEYLQELAAEIGNIKNNCRDIRTYESQKYGTERFRELYRNYEQMKQELRKIDFEDMLIKCRALFLHRPDILKNGRRSFDIFWWMNFRILTRLSTMWCGCWQHRRTICSWWGMMINRFTDSAGRSREL